MATNLIQIPIYQVNSSNRLTSPAATYMAFSATGIQAQPVNIPLNNVNSALIYSVIQSDATGGTQFYSNLTVAQIITLANA